MGRRTFPDRGAQLTLPLAAPATHAARVSVSPALVVEPSAHHAEHALRRGAANATTLALLESRLVRHLLPEARVADEAVARVVLRVATSTIVAPDLLDAIDGALTSLHAAHVDPEHLLAATSSSAVGVRDRAALIAGAMRAHQDALSSLGLVDRRALPGLLARALGNVADVASLSEPLSHALVIEVRDFATIPPARLAWLESLHVLLSRAGGRVVLHSPTAQGSLLLACGIDDPRERIAASLEARLADHPMPPDLVHEVPGAGVGPLSQTATRLFSSTTERIESPVELVVAGSARAQAEHAAEVAAAALMAGVAPEQIVIALPSADEEIMRPLRRALVARKIPFYEGRGAPPTDTLAVATLLRILRAIDDRPRKDLLIDILRATAGTARAGARIRTADALARTSGSDLRREGRALTDAMPDDESRELATDWIALLTVAQHPSFAAALTHLRVLGDALGFPFALGRYAADVVRTGDTELLSALAHDLSAWASLAAATDEMARAIELCSAGDWPIDWRELAHELERALSARQLVPGHRAGAISIERLRDRIGLDADVLIILEAHDGALPSRGVADPLLSRTLIDALRARDPRRAPPPSSLSGAVDLLAAVDAIGRAGKRAVVARRSVDESGRTQLPGALAIELARVTTASVMQVREQPPRAHLPLHLILPRVDAEQLRARAFAAATLAPGELSPFTGAIERSTAERSPLFAQKLGATPATALSVSAAEALLSCPFVVFAERVLRANPKDKVDDDGSSRELGELAHLALLEAYRALSAGQSDYATVVRRVLDEAGSASALERVRRERLYSDLVATIAIDLERAEAEGRSFLVGEVPFGEGAEWPALELAHNGERVFVRGQVDRIDRAPHGASIVDYKSRRVAKASTAEFFDGRSRGAAQIALYARAVAENLRPRPERVLARFIGYRDRAIPDKPVGFAKKDDGSIWASRVGGAGGGRGLGLVGEALVHEVAAMRAGSVPARRNERCANCPQRTACRVPPVVLEEAGE